ncbi:LOW QUALITY PROTEIN: NAD kinase 2, chloroplastic-like [Neltuma alba]|uniref:LOW QUALITY PROTEIN: NAD kinase 2, chloroplastic-like n=1 Tax=Neltuma alba TaxID=207710 RepID=UPI0010A3C8E0|nr:LOW QUALITY PROTEIN: NAD kinase 2, chloroplastic-like [Prosopis alba]
MVACLCACHMAFSVDMSLPTSPAIRLLSPSYLCFFTPSSSSGNGKVFGFGSGLGFEWQRKKGRRRLKFVFNAELSNSFSLNFGLDSQNVNSFESHDPSQLPWIGPIPGDIAEIEAYCRIFRSAERFHTALMDALCNPFTGECSVSYDVPSDEKPQLEDKIVSVLGCMVSLMNKGREDILSGRSSVMNSFRTVLVSTMEDNLPPLAIFRNEMKRCCESLHVALENYLISDDDRSINVWRKLQRLKNVCYDSGFPRKEHYPCHTLFANWRPVYFSTSTENTGSKDSEAVFWKGGQVTEEGLKWLLDKGYKTIIDLRAETVKDNFYQTAIHNAIASGKIELVKIPVEVRTAPTTEQVVRFASYVSDGSKRPIYLHSKEGVWRTSAMVSRWKQYITRSASQLVSNQVITSNDRVSYYTKGFRKTQHSLTASKGSFPEKDTNSLQENGVAHGSVGTLDNKKAQSNGALNGSISGDKTISETFSTSNGAGSFSSFSLVANPLKAQVPPRDIFSKREMSNFIGNRNISPPSYFRYQIRGMESLQHSKNMHIVRFQGDMLVSYVDDFLPELVDSRSSNGSAYLDYPSGGAEVVIDGDRNLVARSTSSSVRTTTNGSSDRKTHRMLKTNVSTSMSASSDHVTTKSLKVGDSIPEARLALVEDSEPIEGNMCASSTGVVRVQSRKKAEMFVVRTDGYSCTREKVTESSLAFTHPSTQQQMLMWKSAPKTVLLLKKLGEELMEEAKEVASFLYHQEKMNVVVEPDVHDIFARIPGFGFVQTFYSQDTSDLHEKVDFVACLGGDGVILHASNLFRGAVPPVVSFNLGSLGFLTSHNFDDYKQDLRQVIHGNTTRDGVYITLRMRLRCEIFRKGKAVPGKVFDVLNEVVLDRGSNPYLSKIECYEHDRLITKVQGDGVIVATPTGSTAYSTAAGGSMVHPNVPCMLFTPICPHSLSFRPVILPDSARLELKIPEDARSNAWVSFDGKRRQQLSRGDSVCIYMSQHPLPTVNKFDQTGDWFRSLIRCLNWNERLDQKAL